MTALSQVSTRLEASRRDLLDLSLRNPLLNYRPLQAKGVEIVNEVPAEVYRLLVTEGKAMTFLPVDSKTANSILDTVFNSSENGKSPGEAITITPAQTDNKLQTRETTLKLENRLLQTYHASRLFVEEQGVNILYLALGMLTWYETGNQDDARQAPILLIPVELGRSSARERFQLRYTGGEVGENLSLIAKMKADFNLRIPELPDTEEVDVTSYFDEVWKEIVGRKGWLINSTAIALGFFSFGKFMMYNDLDAANWSEEASPAQHPLLQALLHENGFQEPAPFISDEDHLDPHLNPTEVRQVVDADASQTLAILDVNQGRNLIIQGPPGTGKSQTITNLISEAIGKGKTVLFVAEKMAALEVVKRRLDKVGLGEACLELHSHKTNKKEVTKELARTLNLGKPKVKEQESELNLLVQLRERLNSYCEAVNKPIAQSDLTTYDVYGELLQLREKYPQADLPRFALPTLLSWSRDEFRRRDALVQELQARLKQTGEPTRLLFWGSQRQQLLPAEENQIAQALAAAHQAITALQPKAQQLALVMMVPLPTNRSETVALSALANRLLQSPNYAGVVIKAGSWLQQQAELEQLLTAGKTYAAIQVEFQNKLLPEAWTATAEALEIRENLMTYGEKWWRFLANAYRKSKKKLAGYSKTVLPDSTNEQLKLVDAILEANRQQKVILEFQELGQATFGKQWWGERSDWPHLAKVQSWLTELHQDVTSQLVPETILDFLAGEPNLAAIQPNVQQLEQQLLNHRAHLTEVKQLLLLDEVLRFKQENYLENLPFTEQLTLLQQWQQRLPELHQIVSWNNLTSRLQQEGLQEIINRTLTWPEAGTYLYPAFRQTWLEALLEKAYAERPALQQFQRAGHEEVILKFNELDTLMLAYNRAKLALTHWQNLPLHQAGGQLGILRREFEKKARHLPIRQLMAKAGNAIQAIKPVFMMGPLSIANFLPPECLQFDLVIFDEASQVKPVDAFGALMRAKQAVVVGDSKQMPPTSFFDSLVNEEEVEEENITTDVESILGLFAAQGAPQRMLRWHYRSRHESLIAVSNQEFYENRLVIFPSPDAGRKEIGLIYHHLPHTFYDRGKTRTNPQEAETVAQAIMQHARTHPELTLGVAAFSMAQMQAIINQLETLRKADPEAEAFFQAHPNEPFFVKNLENVQGDERDVIFISTGYGRTADGNLTMNFGPLNSTGGERRLNVLITRARLRCEIFTNLSPDDIDLNRTPSRGVQAFKTFLTYAQNGYLATEENIITPEVEAAPFEEIVYQALTNLGYQLKPKVGSAGFYVDFAAVDPQEPGRYVLGLECDGATYYSARSARDRDRLRQSVMESLGWQLYHVWSTDWFRNPEAELNRLVAAIEQAMGKKAISKTPGSSPKPQPADALVPRDSPTNTEQKTGLPLYQVANLSIKNGNKPLPEVPVATLAEWVWQVVQAESPVHVTEVSRRIAEAAEVPKIGPRIKAALEAAVKFGLQQNAFRQQGDFLWLTSMAQPQPRDRSQLPASARDLDLIAPEEIKLIIQKVITESYGITAEDIAPATSKLLGFPRLTDELREQIDLLVEDLLRTGTFIRQEGHIVQSRR
ncbi:DUF3320 domain-containing protein [Adhaeribacter pallidiroseus]|uniref:Putative ATP-dependent helicase n=1 Tax=Adhaeribacter pallidiroseus TaxID=2072847 RepID=A0A369QRE9_9BACT|nr:DUF3320 domain-containing protein [Adhaeribacter pallidiroseus]RDC65817.1 putative ATP-dependent helicase [Adhaeribacter pallidiroseus]